MIDLEIFTGVDYNAWRFGGGILPSQFYEGN
jgi:hypothetical protein